MRKKISRLTLRLAPVKCVLRSFLSLGIYVPSGVRSALAFFLYFIGKGKTNKEEQKAKKDPRHLKSAPQNKTLRMRVKMFWGIP